MVLKLLHFLSKQGVEFNDGAQIFHHHTALGRKYLGIAKEVEVIDIAALDYPTIFRVLYAEIAKNQSAYEAYNQTHYSYMGLVIQRRILKSQHLYGLFNDIFTSHLDYVNEEHALLVQAHFFKIFGLHTQKNPIEMINTASLALEENIKKIASKDTSVLDSEITRKNVLGTFGIVIQRVSQQYLTDDWRLIEKQKESLYQAIIDLLTKFKELSTSDDITTQQFVTSASTIL